MSISTYEGATVVYTFADQPVLVGLITCLAVAATLFGVAATFIHEKHSYRSPMKHTIR